MFYDDPTVHGNWEAIGSIAKVNFEKFVAGTASLTDMGIYIKYLSLDSDGSAKIYFSEHDISPVKWTNGYLIDTHNVRVCEELFTVEVSGERFLLKEIKTGDYWRDKVVWGYLVFRQISSIPGQTTQTPDTGNSQPGHDSEPEFVLERSDNNNPNKITYYTIKNDEGYYEDRFDQYVFYDDPTVHGSWKNVGSVFKTDLIDWAAGKIFMTPNRDTVWISSITLNSDGTAAMPNIWLTQHWTNGYYISSAGDGQTVMELFTVNVNGTEYLLLENKTGDYHRELKSNFYFIFERE